MAEQATERMVVDASPDKVWAVLTDFVDYPSWAHGLKSVTVRSRDEQDRPLDVTYRAAAMGRSTSYTLRYDYRDGPRALRWTLVESDIVRALDGSYELNPVDGNSDKTELTYHLEVDVAVPLPNFVKRRAEGRIFHTALDDLRDHLEG